MINVPRKRILGFIRKGDAHLYCSFNPQWTQNPELFYWSEDLFEDSNYIIESEDLSPNTEAMVGAISKFVYSKNINTVISKYGRHDFKSYEQLFRFYDENRIERIVSSDLIYRAHKKSFKNITSKILKESVSPHKIYCVISKRIPLKISAIKKAIQNLKQNGQINKIVEQYK